MFFCTPKVKHVRFRNIFRATMSSLINQIIRASSAMDPVATTIQPRLQALPTIRCILFDVYGTLMVSGVGDISHSSDEDRDASMQQTARAHCIRWKHALSRPGKQFKAVIHEHHRALKSRGILFPEVDIREVWRDFLKRFAHPSCSLNETQLEQLSLDHELSINPTWPMPGLTLTLEELSRRTQCLGIISNAQFFTPLLFQAYLGHSLEQLGFSNALCQWSYQLREAKPGTRLYEANVKALQELHIQPAEVLYVGNDMLNDILPATQVGFKTALFAGDQRSLRLREEDTRIAGIQPDLILTQLEQLLECIPGAA